MRARTATGVEMECSQRCDTPVAAGVDGESRSPDRLDDIVVAIEG